MLERHPPDDVYRWGVLASSLPILFFIGSIPLAFLSTTLAVLLWFGAVPLHMVLGQWRPANVDEYFG